MIDPTINIRSKPIHSAQQKSLVKGNAAIARADAAVQTRAYELYELRGRKMAGLKRTGTKQKPTSEKQRTRRGPKMQAEALAKH